MTGDVVTLGTGSATVLPFASETEIVGTLAANMIIAEMVVEGLGVGEILPAIDPKTLEGGRLGGWGGLGVVLGLGDDLAGSRGGRVWEGLGWFLRCGGRRGGHGVVG